MNTARTSVGDAISILFALACCAGASLVHAEDIVPAKDQSDTQISVWVDNASLDVFISELASITGRGVSIDGDLPGQVSGRFNGSMADTLGFVSEQFPVLFDLDDSTLGAVAATERSSATIALGDAVLDSQMKSVLLDEVIPGNKLEIRDNEVLVSGHPTYVSRLAKKLISIVADSNTKTSPEPLTTKAIPAIAESADEADVQVPEPVIDTAAQVILDEAMNEDDSPEPSETASISTSTSGEIRWVTDIPGFETF